MFVLRRRRFVVVPMLAAVDPDEPAQGESDARPKIGPIESCEEERSSDLSCAVEPGKPDATTPFGGHMEPVDSEKGSSAVSGANFVELEEKKTDADNPPPVAAPDSCDGGDRAPFGVERMPAAPSLQRQTSKYAVHTEEEVEELENMIKAIAPTPRKAKRVYNMYVTRSAHEMRNLSCSRSLLLVFHMLGC